MFPLFKFKIAGNSMFPTFESGDEILVNRLSYLLSKPSIGDVIVIKKNKFIIKRITKIKKNEFFIVGDNGERSIDSRDFGWISKKEIVGKVMFKI